jgi:hypothetical protein
MTHTLETTVDMVQNVNRQETRAFKRRPTVASPSSVMQEMALLHNCPVVQYTVPKSKYRSD